MVGAQLPPGHDADPGDTQPPVVLHRQTAHQAVARHHQHEAVSGAPRTGEPPRPHERRRQR